MKHTYLFTIVVILFVLFSCKGTIKKPPEKLSVDTIFTINVDNPNDVIDLKLSELADSFKIIQLETTKNTLIGGSIFYVSDNYIISFDQNGILKFSSNGKFLCKIAGIGRGPHEVTIFTSYYIDEERDIMFLDDILFKYAFLVYDIKSEKFLDPVKKCVQTRWYSFYVVNDSMIAGTSDMETYGGATQYAVFYQNMKGDFLYGIPNTRKTLSVPDQKEVFQNCRLRIGDKILHASFDHNDTLFKLIDNNFIPYLALSYDSPRRVSKSYVSKGDHGIQFSNVEAPSFLLLRNVIVDNVIHISETTDKYERKFNYIFFNKTNGKSSRIKSFTDNFIGQTQISDGHNISFPQILSNGTLYISYSPNEIKEAIARGLNYQDFPTSLNVQLLEINKSLTEMDNPILLVGKIKSKL